MVLKNISQNDKSLLKTVGFTSALFAVTAASSTIVANAQEVEIQPGETLGILAERHSTTVEELKEIIDQTPVPFIVKGIMTVKGALKAKEAGASAIVVSNHGGRVLDSCPATADVLEDIVKAVGQDMKILVDGGIRSGTDVFKALALGADGVIIARPFVNAVYGGAKEGIQALVDKLGLELKDAMEMCGAKSLSDISRDMICK